MEKTSCILFLLIQECLRGLIIIHKLISYTPQSDPLDCDEKNLDIAREEKNPAYPSAQDPACQLLQVSFDSDMLTTIPTI